jgi:DNA-binding phage protein
LLKADRLEEGNELLTFLNEALTDQDEYLDFFNKASTKMERDRAASSAAWEGIERRL